VLAPERLTHVVSAASARPHLATPAVHVLPTPSIAVERRGLAAYAQLAEAYAEEVA
jgi:hypothetical protein